MRALTALAASLLLATAAHAQDVEYKPPAASATPGGSDTQVQYNDSGVFGGEAGLTYAEGTDMLTVVGGVNVGGSAATAGSLQWNTTQTVDNNVFAVGTTGRALVLIENGDTGFDFAHAQQTNPTLIGHSATQSTTQWWSLTHDGTNGILDVGTGSVAIPDALVVGASSAITATFLLDVVGGSSASKALFRTTGATQTASIQMNGDSGANGYGAVLQAGSSHAASSFGTSWANRVLLISDGSSSNGMLIGALTDDTVVFGQNDAESFKIDTNGDIDIASGLALILTSKVMVATAPTISAGLCTSPAVTAANGTAAFLLTVGTSCTGVTTGTLAMPAATTGWVCHFANTTTPASNTPSQTGGTTTTVTFTNYARTTGIASDFTASEVIRVMCSGY